MLFLWSFSCGALKDFTEHFSVYSLVFISIKKKIYQTLETLFRHISKHFEFRQKYFTVCHIINSLLGVWKSDETRLRSGDKQVLPLFLDVPLRLAILPLPPDPE